MIRAVIFDCFGVIITDALQVAVEELQATNPPAATRVIDIIHANNRGMMSPAESNRQIADAMGLSVEAWRERIHKGEVKDGRLLAYIRELRQHYKTALLTNIGHESLRRRFSEEELLAHFDVVVVSAELGVMKPEAEIYLHAANKLGVRPAECVMIDDRETHCAGACAVGMQAILYRNLLQLKQELARLLHDNDTQ